MPTNVACLQLRHQGGRSATRSAAPPDVLTTDRAVARRRFHHELTAPDLALARPANDAGVHVGQEDASYADARKLLGPDKIVGVTCYNSRDLAIDAAEAGADYVAFGGFFRSTTKDTRRIAGNLIPRSLTLVERDH